MKKTKQIKIKCPACNGTGAEFPGNPRTEKCQECDGAGVRIITEPK